MVRIQIDSLLSIIDTGGGIVEVWELDSEDGLENEWVNVIPIWKILSQQELYNLLVVQKPVEIKRNILETYFKVIMI